MEIYLIRHTTPAIAKGICYGQSDIGLAPTFPVEKEKILAQLPAKVEAVYSSPLQRCHMLAQCIPTPQLYTDARLMEVSFGAWEMQAWNDIPADQLTPWMEDFVCASPPGGESMMQMYQRVLAFWQELQRTTHQTVAIITHGGVIRLLMAHVENRPLSTAFDLKVKYGEVLRIEV